MISGDDGQRGRRQSVLDEGDRWVKMFPRDAGVINRRLPSSFWRIHGTAAFR